MIIICASCSTRFQLEATRLGAAGRRVRCSRCGHEWFQAPPDTPDVPEPAPEPSEPAALPPPAAMRADQPSAAVRPMPPRPMPAAEPRTSGLALGWVALALFLVVVGGTLVLARNDVMTAWPATKRLYAVLGMTPPALGEGLAIQDVKTAAGEDGSTPVLVITGVVRNLTGEEREVPPLRAALRDAQGAELRNWTFLASKTRVEKGGSLEFETRTENPPGAATGLSIIFQAPAR